MNEIKAKEGYYLSDNDKTTFYKSVKGANVSEDDYIQVEETEEVPPAPTPYDQSHTRFRAAHPQWNHLIL